MFEALIHSGRPDFRRLGFGRVHVVDRGFWTDDAHPGTVDPAKLASLVAALPRDGGPIAIDIESLDLHRANPAMPRNLARLAAIAQQFRATAHGHPIGYYGLLPLADYWRAIDVPPGGAADWQGDNTAAAPLERRVEIIFPSLYTYYRDQAGWVRQAKAMICEARRISGKPVYAFVWPEFHDSTADAGREIPADYWTLELETLHGIADGVVIWGGYDLQANHARPWDENAAWWQATKAALRRWHYPPGK